jgi:hypothetical protein
MFWPAQQKTLRLLWSPGACTRYIDFFHLQLRPALRVACLPACLPACLAVAALQGGASRERGCRPDQRHQGCQRGAGERHGLRLCSQSHPTSMLGALWLPPSSCLAVSQLRHTTSLVSHTGTHARADCKKGHEIILLRLWSASLHAPCCGNRPATSACPPPCVPAGAC